MYEFLSLLSTYYAAGGKGGGAGFGDVLPTFISSCLFGCALDFFLFVGKNCEHVASK